MHFNIQFQPPLSRYQVVALSEVLFIKYLLPKIFHFFEGLKGQSMWCVVHVQSILHLCMLCSEEPE